MAVVVGIVGGALVVLAFVDMVNILVATSTSFARLWPSHVLTRTTYRVIRAIASRLPDGSRARERILATFAPLLLLELLAMWVVLQVTGFALLWWAADGLPSLQTWTDAFYYSGVVFFTVGFGEIVPEATGPRAGALLEAFVGVVTTALVVGYLPSLYGAYSERERALMLIDAGSPERITPLSLIKAWAPDADPKKLDAEFTEWELWAASILETHTTLPMLRYFRSHEPKQHWVTALGLLTDAAGFTQLILGAYDGAAYRFQRRATEVFHQVTLDAPDKALDPYRDVARQQVEITPEVERLFRDLYQDLTDHGFDLVPLDIALSYMRPIRAEWSPQMEYLIDQLLCPRGFWGPQVTSVPLLSSEHPEMLTYIPPPRS